MALAPSPPRPNPRPQAPQSDLQAGSFKPKSFEDQVRYAYHTPAPNTYLPKKPERGNGKALGKISDSKIPSALDHGQREKSLVPGPGSYDTPDQRDIALPEGGRLSRKPPQEKFRLDEYPVPPPGTYGIPQDPTLPRQLYGSFGKDPRVSKFIQDEVNRSKSVPAPGEHEVMDSMESLRPFCPEGGRYLEQVGRGPSYFEEAAKLADSKPGPDRYNLPGSIRPNKAAGKLVWKYQSETLKQTKAIITKVVGTGHENPAPGTYDLPDPAPLAASPVLRGRGLAHGMPHPYAYNCSPDLSGKFDTMSPVRTNNSGAQIYGRDFSKGAASKDSRTSKARASADEVVATNNMPVTLAERDIEQPGETVQWRSGGFAGLHKVKSSPVISRREHPSVEQCMQSYPSLSRLHGRQDKTFMPMTSKRQEIIKTHPKSVDCKQFHRQKYQLGALAAEIKATTLATLEPLDEAKLREEATKGLMDKAKFKMRMEGLGKDQQDLVLAELPGVLQENASSAKAEDAFFGGEPGLAGEMPGPFVVQGSSSSSAVAGVPGI